MLLQILQDPWEHFFDLRYKHLNTWTKVGYAYTSHVARMLNFSMKIIHSPYWGWPDENGSYDGVIGQIQRGEVDIGGGGIFMQKGRLDVVDFASTTNIYNGKFVFLQPQLPEVQEIFSLPFDTMVWYTIIGTTAVITISLKMMHKLQATIQPNGIKEQPLTWSDACLDSLGIICQEGANGSPTYTSMRIVFLMMLFLSVFLYTSYSAIIVVLLQAPASPISTITDLMASPLKLCMQDLISNTRYVNETIDPDIKRLYREKLYNQPPAVAFTSPEIGISRVQKGLVAFHGDMSSGFKIISDTFEEHEKCRLRYVQMISTVMVTIPVTKGSQYEEHIRQKIIWLRESGLLDREDKVWVSQPPKCSKDDGQFVIIGLTEFFPVIQVFLYGVLFSIILLIIEFIVNKALPRILKQYRINQDTKISLGQKCKHQTQ
ncbi:hypothetical protein L9F63_019598 [Diploptera punctata]|uniref:Ionotropic glutamate receptor C-terminal domain-containing protein n=1 Tax=Diploptera punctata TaxID=6984 RepID=A0AAD8EEH4_DIPPU|nr:hypothetical protein L9F63_019598 [Diploptera punctata]